MLSQHVSAIERGDWRFPQICTAYLAHEYARVGDLYSTKADCHLPDEVCAFELMQQLRSPRPGPRPTRWLSRAPTSPQSWSATSPRRGGRRRGRLGRSSRTSATC
jgi:hypothetical protein